MQALYAGADSCSYPKISLGDASSSSSEETQGSAYIHRSTVKNKGRPQHPPPALPRPDSAPPSPGVRGDEEEEEGDCGADPRGWRLTSSPRSGDELGRERTASRCKEREARGDLVEASDSAEESGVGQSGSSLVLDGSLASPGHLSPGVNGQRRTGGPHGAQPGPNNPTHSSESEGEAVSKPTDTRTLVEEQASLRGQGGVKRTHRGSGEGGSGAQPSEKKFKT